MEIINFKNFEQFKAYIKQHGKEMPQWSSEKTEQFVGKVSKLMEESPEFKEKYDHWVKQMELKEKIKQHKVVSLGGTEEDTMYSRAYLKLKESAKKKKTEADKGKNLSPAVISKCKKSYTI